jgi:predicted RNA-binding Zn ribbon-like protein
MIAPPAVCCAYGVRGRQRMTVVAEQDDAVPEPGGRAPAPGELALVQAFVNTHFDRAAGGGETLTTPEALAGWLRARGLLEGGRRVDRRGLERALAVREGIRALAFANNDHAVDGAAIDAMREASRGATTAIRIEPDGARFDLAGAAPVDAAIGAVLAVVARAMIDGSWPRLKACPGRGCGWAFYDRSRNQSARWCAMKVCGDREKARAYYERRTGQPG